MINSKKINIIVIVLMVFAFTISVFVLMLGGAKNTGETNTKTSEYSAEIFASEIISIDIIAAKSDWQNMLDNAINEEYIMVDVVVNGTLFKSVGIRPKGNSSLTQVVNSDSDRYSFRFQFDKYIKYQTCFGLDSFVVNNIISDNTYMKEYISYDLMREIGVDTPEFGFADIKVNGEAFGLYLAIEAYDTSYEQRVYNDITGALYNVKNTAMEVNINGMGGNNLGQIPMGNSISNKTDSNAQRSDSFIPDFNREDSSKNSEWFNNADGGFMDKALGGNFVRGSTGGSLQYTDNKVGSYSAIFDNVVGKGAKYDYKKVIKALKKLSEGEELEKYFEVDKILRYLAAHTIVVNLDSYSSSMAQNYYIYEHDGKITILPWDYNLAWGGFQSGDASSVINFPIDTPLSGVEMEDRPLIEKLFANTEYLNRYHTYLQELMDEYFADGKFEEKVNTLNTLISDYVKNDKTAFCTYEEYEKAVSSLITLGNLRAESIQGQLDGTIPSTTEGQKANSTLLISAGDLSLSDLGSMMGGGKRNENNMPNRNDMTGSEFDFTNQSPPGTENDGTNQSPPDMSFPRETERFREGNSNRNTENSGNGLKLSGASGINGLIIIVVSMVMLIVAMIFTTKTKKSY